MTSPLDRKQQIPQQTPSVEPTSKKKTGGSTDSTSAKTIKESMENVTDKTNLSDKKITKKSNDSEQLSKTLEISTNQSTKTTKLEDNQKIIQKQAKEIKRIKNQLREIQRNATLENKEKQEIEIKKLTEEVNLLDKEIKLIEKNQLENISNIKPDEKMLKMDETIKNNKEELELLKQNPDIQLLMQKYEEMTKDDKDEKGCIIS